MSGLPGAHDADGDRRRDDPDVRRTLERWHDSPVEEWVFTCWVPPGDEEPLGVVSGYRILRNGGAGTSWYWAAVARPGRPLLQRRRLARSAAAGPAPGQGGRALGRACL